MAPADAAPAPASTAAAKKRPAPLRPVDSIAWPRALDSAIGAEAQPAAAGVVGSEDRLWHLALVAAPGRPLLRAPAPAKKQAGSVARPKSRGECERRCGGVGRCDAGHADGCGGALCAADATNATDDAEVV
ncbi:hypothetical protein H7U20_17155 [Rugamonas sp. CCM 8940]|uniref:hypothetical protein n=1 Tax=Rugamonas sp. CCM 8940 TaxID=2765359 RepID=UPI0018F49E9E|nr:hypothetical protein [Rugamonas sp. CCM 8940]MBJ7311913.1 hypothetical protein [Rugamonas sp. CCM 8940]